MKEISQIRPAYPIVPVKRRDQESKDDDRAFTGRSKKKSPAQTAGDDDSSTPLIDEYV